MNKNLLNDAVLENVTGGRGTYDGKQSWEYDFAISLPTYVHKGCGGRIIQGDIFHKCRCEGCGKAYYWLESFDYYKVYGIRPPEIPAN